MKKVFKYEITYLVLIVLFRYPFGIYSERIMERHPCYGKLDTIICNENQRISIHDLQYEKNCSSCAIDCPDGRFCEKFRQPGSWVNYYYYNAVSGNIAIQYTAQRTLCLNSENARIFANQVHLQFECINGKCGTNQNSYLQFDSANNTIKCHDKQLLGGNTTIFNTTSSSLNIQLHIDGHPQSVWIGITASTGSYVNVSCENTPPTEVLSTEVIISNDTSLTDSVTTSPTDVTKSSTDVATISSTSLAPKEPKRSMNAERTTEVIRTSTYTKSIQTSDFDPATTDMTRLTTLHLETSNLSTSPEKTLVSKETSIVKITTGKMIDPAIIVLILTGFFTLVLVIIGAMIGRKRYVESRLVRNHSDAIRELSKRNTDENKELNEYTSFAQSNESHILHHEIKNDNSSTVYSQVERKRQNGQLSSEYDHINYKGSAKSMNSNIDNEPDNYSHLRPYNNPERGYGQYDKVELGNIENNSQTLTRPLVLQASIEPPPDSKQGQQYINPYVDEAVIKGMVIDNELRRSLASSMDFDESIRDMMTHATS